MTQEEKAIRYDEVKNKLSRFIAQGVDPLITRADVQDFFPELAESEDEKIRKEIVNAIHDYAYRLEEKIPTEWLAWLEKQGEHANFRNKIQIGDKVTRNEDGVLVNLSQLKRVAKKQGEQKPTDKVEPKFKVKYAGSEYNVFETKDIAGVTFYGIEDEPNHIDYVKAENCEIISGYGIKENGSPYPTKPAKFSEQKPAWSEEDNWYVEDIISLLDLGGSIHTKEQVQDWLKSLKGRVQPQNTWKPSELQLGCLSDAIEHYNSLGYPAPKLKELYEQLKKL